MSAEPGTNVVAGAFGHADAAPHDLDMERMLLAAIIADNAVLDKIADFEPERLFDPFHAGILGAMLDLRGDGRPINLVTLKPRFGATPFTTGGTVFDYIKGFEFAGAMPAITDLADALTELHLRRDMLGLGERMAASVWDQAIGPRPLMASFLRELDDLLARTAPAKKTHWTAQEAVDDMLDGMLNPTNGDLIPTGFADLDAMIGGWENSTYVVVAGRPSMGKSAMAAAVARRVAKAGHGVAVFSLEMSKNQWMARTICDEIWDSAAPVPLQNVLRNRLSDAQFEHFSRGSKIIRDLKTFEIEERGGLSIEEIAAQTRQIAEAFRKEGKELRMIVIDHMGKVKPSGRYKGNRVQEVTELSLAIAELAKAERVTVLALCQLNRAVEGRDNKRAGLSDLRESGAIEQDADIVLFPYRPAYYLERLKCDNSEDEALRLSELAAVRNLLEVNVAKSRNGPTGNIELFIDMASNAIRNSGRHYLP